MLLFRVLFICNLLILYAWGELVRTGQINANELRNAKKLINEMSEIVEDVADTFDKGGNININIVGTYMKVLEIGDVYEKWKKGDVEGAGKDLAEAIATLVLFDVPGVVQPAIEAFNDIILDENDPSMKGVQDSIKSVNGKVKKILKRPGESMRRKIHFVGKKYHQMKGSVSNALENGLKGLRTSVKNSRITANIAKASQFVNVMPESVGKSLGAGLTKVGGTMNVLSIMYASYKFGDALVEKNYDDAIEQGIVITGALVSIVAGFAASGSILGPIGTVAGALIGKLENTLHKLSLRFVFAL